MQNSSSNLCSKMSSETVLLYILLAIFGIVGMILAHLILKYLNQKPLGMQTIFDQMIKDQIYLTISLWAVHTIILTSIECTIPINHNFALGLSLLNFMLLLAKIWQFSMILVIRYFSVFYQNIMNSLDECFVKRLVRSFVGIVSIISALISDLENTVAYLQITKKSVCHACPMMLFISPIVCVIILIVTQYKIELFKRSVDVQAKFDQVDEEMNNQESTRTNYNKNTVRIVLSLSSVGLFVLILKISSYYLTLSTPDYIHFLITSSALNFIYNIAIPVIYIVRNDNLYHFCQFQIMEIFKCCRK